jgi:hypothetical protein
MPGRFRAANQGAIDLLAMQRTKVTLSCVLHYGATLWSGATRVAIFMPAGVASDDIAQNYLLRHCRRQRLRNSTERTTSQTARQYADLNRPPSAHYAPLPEAHLAPTMAALFDATFMLSGVNNVRVCVKWCYALGNLPYAPQRTREFISPGI